MIRETSPTSSSTPMAPLESGKPISYINNITMIYYDFSQLITSLFFFFFCLMLFQEVIVIVFIFACQSLPLLSSVISVLVVYCMEFRPCLGWNGMQS